MYISDILRKDLAGWQIMPCYFLQLTHTLMGTFPAITNEGKIILVSEKQLLKKIWDRLERRPAQVTEIVTLAHLESGSAFSLARLPRSDAKAIHISSTQEIEDLCKEPKSFGWAPGLFDFSLSPTVEDPLFT